jgi:hypothetical protein
MKTLNIILAACVVAAMFCAPAKAQEPPNTLQCIFDLSSKMPVGVNFTIRFEVELTDKSNGREVDSFSPNIWTPVHVNTTLYEYVIWDENGAGDRGPFKLTIDRYTKKATVFFPAGGKGPVTYDNGECQPKSKL